MTYPGYASEPPPRIWALVGTLMRHYQLDGALAFIGKNLADKLTIRGAGDVPSTGGSAGTPEGFLGDLSGGTIRPRQYEVEVSWRF